MTSDHGHIVIEAGSGSRDAKDEHGFVVMEPFAAGTREDLYEAVRAGAVIYPVFGDYGDRDEPSIVEFGPEIRRLDSPAPRARASARSSPAWATAPAARRRSSTPTSAGSGPRSATATTRTDGSAANGSGRGRGAARVSDAPTTGLPDWGSGPHVGGTPCSVRAQRCGELGLLPRRRGSAA